MTNDKRAPTTSECIRKPCDGNDPPDLHHHQLALAKAKSAEILAALYPAPPPPELCARLKVACDRLKVAFGAVCDGLEEAGSDIRLELQFGEPGDISPQSIPGVICVRLPGDKEDSISFEMMCDVFATGQWRTRLWEDREDVFLLRPHILFIVESAVAELTRAKPPREKLRF